MMMRWAWVLVFLVVTLAWSGEAAADESWHLTDTCKGESTHYFKSRETCQVYMDSYANKTPVGCYITCERYYGGSSAGGSSGGSSSSASITGRKFGQQRWRYPWGRTITHWDLAAVAYTVGSGDSTTGVTPGGLIFGVRAAPWLHVGLDAWVLEAKSPEDGKAFSLITYGGALRVVLKSGITKRRKGYWELYVDTTANLVGSLDQNHSADGRVFSGGLGLSLATVYLIGFGVSSRYHFGSASVEAPTREGDVKLRAWNTLLAHVSLVF